MYKYLLALGLVFNLTSAYAQSPVQQSGSVTVGHALRWTADRTVSDAGPATGGNQNIGITALPIVGTGTPLCIYDAPITNALGYHSMCFGANVSGTSEINLSSGGGADPLGLIVNLNGTSYSFPASGAGTGSVNGPNSSTVNEFALWNDTTGTLLKNGSGAITHTGDMTVVGNLTSSATLAAATLGISGNSSIGGTLAVTGLETVSDGFEVVSGATTLSGTLTVAGDTVLQNASAVDFGATGNVNIGGTLSITGNTTLSNLTAVGITATGNTSLGGTLTVTGATTLNGGLTVAFGNVTIAGNQSTSGTLNVTGTGVFTGDLVAGRMRTTDNNYYFDDTYNSYVSLDIPDGRYNFFIGGVLVGHVP